MNKYLYCIVFALMGCNAQNKEIVKKTYVDEIFYDERYDSDEFECCYEDEYIIQYFNDGNGLAYKGEKIALIEEVEKQFIPSNKKKDSGLIRIRFIVNCNGQAGRFRLIGMDENYKEKKFSKKITAQLMTITKHLDGWKIKTINDRTRDYYQYLIFKLEKGSLVKILP